MGGVLVVPGSGSGLTATGDKVWTQKTSGIAGAGEVGDGFGHSVLTGDFDNDSRSDLLVGVPFEDVGPLLDAGAVNVIYGSSTGLTASGDQLFSQASSGVAGASETGDLMGSATNPTPSVIPGTRAFEPWLIYGTGNRVPSIDIPGDKQGVLRIDMDGPSNSIVWSLDSNFDFIDLLVNEIGAYTGGRPVNTGSIFDDPVRFLDIDASGDWTIYVEPLAIARTYKGSISGNTDDVINLGKTGITSFDYDGTSNFIVWAYELGGDTDLIVNEIGPWSGQEVISSSFDYIDVVGIGDWTIKD